MTENKINVLVVDDSAVARMHLVHLLESDPQLRVVGPVNDGQAALDFVQENKPDVILMDVNMPGLDGFETTRRIMETQAVPVVICSGTTSPKDVASTFRVLEAGAIACVEKPVGREHPDYERVAAELRQVVKLMAEVKVVRRWPGLRTAAAPAPVVAPRVGLGPEPAKVSLIGIGASTGGPPVLQTILAGLPKEFSVPILIVQHIAPGFLPGMVEWLNQTTGLRVHVAAHLFSPLPGHVYLAPDDYHMGLSPGNRIVLSQEEPDEHLRPAVSYLFRSLARLCGPAAVGVLLTGMGKDGAAELKLMRDHGATTIAQDRESSVVHGMPGAAIALGGATRVLPADQIADALLTLIAHRNGGGEH